ncbi:L-carnitine dehydratase bile acid-inducible protein f [Mycena venus]|uniref:L-carnitine dehydratase bile acid-inducible protein f n=1 Tax=Mycena venus TaxID=2733690 RepID=A0A8H7CP00_9AGAR|nr:L-carnitine dehydratase bile acid-inducible protein f [Mycena venus]
MVCAKGASLTRAPNKANVSRDLVERRGCHRFSHPEWIKPSPGFLKREKVVLDGREYLAAIWSYYGSFHLTLAVLRGRIVKGFSPVQMRAVFSAPFSTSTTPGDDLLLAGIRVLELSQLIAGPIAGQLLVNSEQSIKIEAPKKRDPLRVWHELDVDGCSPWFQSIGRNKRSVATDLRTDEERDLVRRLALPLGRAHREFQTQHAREMVTRCRVSPAPQSGRHLHPYQRLRLNGPWASRPVSASVCEAESGFRFINEFLTLRPTAWVGVPYDQAWVTRLLGHTPRSGRRGQALALPQRQRERGEAGATTVDVSVLESMLNLMEAIVLTNAYLCLPRPRPPTRPSTSTPHLVGPRTHQHQAAHQAEIEDAIATWTRVRSAEEVEKRMVEARMPVRRVRSPPIPSSPTANPSSLQQGRDGDRGGGGNDASAAAHRAPAAQLQCRAPGWDGAPQSRSMAMLQSQCAYVRQLRAAFLPAVFLELSSSPARGRNFFNGYDELRNLTGSRSQLKRLSPARTASMLKYFAWPEELSRSSRPSALSISISARPPEGLASVEDVCRT